MSQEYPDESSNDESLGVIACQLGPNGSFYLRCRSLWTWYYIRNVDARASRGRALDDFSEHVVQDPYIVALAPNDSWFVATKDRKGTFSWKFIYFNNKAKIQIWSKDEQRQWNLQSKVNDPYETLSSWLSENLALSHEQLRKSTVVFGPENSFYARTPNGCVWNNLPDDLETEIIDEIDQEGRGPPRSVTLGRNRSWVAFWNNGSQSWNLRGHYDVVRESFNDDSNARGGIVSVTLSPYNDNFFIHHRDGCLRWRVNLDGKELEDFRRTCYGYMQKRAREDNAKFEIEDTSPLPSRIGKSPFKSSFVISPTTKFDEWDGKISRSLTDPTSWISSISGKTRATRWSDDPKPVLIGTTIGAGAAFLKLPRPHSRNDKQRTFFKKTFDWIRQRRR